MARKPGKQPTRTVRDRRKLGEKKSGKSPAAGKPARGPALKPSLTQPRSHLQALAGKLPGFQAETRYRYTTLTQIRDAARKSQPVAQTLKRTTGMTVERLDELLDREFLEIHPVNRRIKEINESKSR